MDNLKYLEDIEAYVDERMSVEDRRQFEARLQTDAELKKEYDAYRSTMKLLEWMATDELQEQADTPNKNRRKVWWVVAAAVIIALLGTILYINFAFSAKDLAETAYVTPNFSTILRSGSINTTEDEAIQTLLQNNYDEVIAMLSNVSDTNAAAQYILGHTYWKTADYANAISAFENVLENQNTNTRQEASAEWFLALAHLKNDDQAAANSYLNQIITDDNHPNRNKALDLLDDLNSPWQAIVW